MTAGLRFAPSQLQCAAHGTVKWNSESSITSTAPARRCRTIYEDRLKIVEAYDRAGFYAYHLAEHHSTPLGMAPSPNVFLAALAQRTRAAALRPDGLRRAALSSAAADLGNLHARPDERRPTGAELRPRRLADRARIFRHRSGGGAGHLQRGRRGDPERAHAQDARFSRQAFQLRQRADGDAAAAEAAPADLVRRARARQRRARGAPRAQRGQPRSDRRISRQPSRAITRPGRRPTAPAPLPKIGLGRFVVVAETDAEAMRLASRAYPALASAASPICRGCAAAPQDASAAGRVRRRSWSAARASPVRPRPCADLLAAQLAETGCNYVVGQFAFGDLTLDEASALDRPVHPRGDAGVARRHSGAERSEEPGIHSHGFVDFRTAVIMDSGRAASRRPGMTGS